MVDKYKGRTLNKKSENGNESAVNKPGFRVSLAEGEILPTERNQYKNKQKNKSWSLHPMALGERREKKTYLIKIKGEYKEEKGREAMNPEEQQEPGKKRP